MDYLFEAALLFLFSFVIIAVVSVITYFLIFRKYKNRLYQDDVTSANKAKSRLKYCLTCGKDLDKKGFCSFCNVKY